MSTSVVEKPLQFTKALALDLSALAGIKGASQLLPSLPASQNGIPKCMREPSNKRKLLMTSPENPDEKKTGFKRQKSEKLVKTEEVPTVELTTEANDNKENKKPNAPLPPGSPARKPRNKETPGTAEKLKMKFSDFKNLANKIKSGSLKPIGYGTTKLVFSAENIDNKKIALMIGRPGKNPLPDFLKAEFIKRSLSTTASHVALPCDFVPYSRTLDGPIQTAPLGKKDLKNHINTNLSLQEKTSLITGIAKGVSSLHSKGFIHLDLKPANCLDFNSGKSKVTDFGCCKQISKLKPEEIILLTPIYRAPEMTFSQDGFHHCDTSIDYKACEVFTLGLIVYEILSGTNPLIRCEKEMINKDRGVIKGVQEHIKNLKQDNPFNSNLKIKNLTLKMLDEDPKKRPNTTEIIQTLESIEILSTSSPTPTLTQRNQDGEATQPYLLNEPYNPINP